MNPSHDTPVPPQSASPTSHYSALRVPAPDPNSSATHCHPLPAHDTADDSVASASDTLHHFPYSASSPERHPAATSSLAAGLVFNVAVPSATNLLSHSSLTTGEGGRASHTAVIASVPTPSHGVSPVTHVGVKQKTRVPPASEMVGSFPTNTLTRTRGWLTHQRRPRRMPHPCSIAVNSNSLLCAGYGSGGHRAVVDDAQGFREKAPPPLVHLSPPTDEGTSSVRPASAHSLWHTTTPNVAAAAPWSTAALQASSPELASAMQFRGENVAAAACGNPNAPTSSSPAVTGTAVGGTSAPVVPEAPLAEGLHRIAAPPLNSRKVDRATRPGSPCATKASPQVSDGGARDTNTGVVRNPRVLIHRNIHVEGEEEVLPASRMPLATAAAAAAAAADGAAHDNESVEITSSRAAASVPTVPVTNAGVMTAFRLAIPGADGAAADVADVPVQHVLSSPLRSSVGLLDRHPGAHSRRDSSSTRSGVCHSHGRVLLHTAPSDGCDDNTMRAVKGSVRSPSSEASIKVSTVQWEDVKSSPAACQRRQPSAVVRGPMGAGDGGPVATGDLSGSFIESHRQRVGVGEASGTGVALPAPAAVEQADNVTPTSLLHSSVQQGTNETASGHPTTLTASRRVSLTLSGVGSSSVIQRATSYGHTCSKGAAVDQASPLPGFCKSARVVLATAYDPAHRSDSDTSKSWGMSGFGDSAASPQVPPTSAGVQRDSLRAFRVHRYHTMYETQRRSRHEAVSHPPSQVKPQRPRAAAAADNMRQKQTEDLWGRGDRIQDGHEQGRFKAAQPYPEPPVHQQDGAAVVSSLQRFLSTVPISSSADTRHQQSKFCTGKGDRTWLCKRLPSDSSPLSLDSAAALPPEPPLEPPPPPPPPTFALFGALERLSRFSEMVQLCQEHADVLDAFLHRLTLQLHCHSCTSPLLTSGAAAARSQSSSQPFWVPGATHEDAEFLRWHRIVMYLLRQPSEVMKVGVEFFSDAVNSWPLHMLYLTCCFYVAACEQGFAALTTTLSRGGIICSGKGLFAALAVSMARNEEDLIRSTACMYRAAFYTGALMHRRHQNFEAEARLTTSGGFTLLVVNIPIITLQRLVARVNEGYDVFASMRDIGNEKEATRGSVWFSPNSNNTTFNSGTASTFPGRRGACPYSPVSSCGYASGSSHFARPTPYHPHSVIEMSRVISSRAAVLCGHPLDMLRLDMVLTRFADFSDAKIHKEYLPAGGPENSNFYNKHMAHELMGLWKARGVSFSLSSVQLPLYSPVNGDLWTESPRQAFDASGLPDASAASMTSAYDNNTVFSSLASPPTEDYRDEWWMFSVAEAATCANQDLTYSLRHMRDGNVLLDFSTQTIRIGRLMTWTNKSITVLAVPENRHEASVMPPPRRSPKDEAVRNTMKKMAIINDVLREVGRNIERPLPALESPSVELFTTFTKLGLLEVLQEPRERGVEYRFGAPTHVAPTVVGGRENHRHGHSSTDAGNVPSEGGPVSEASATGWPHAVQPPEDCSGGVCSNDPVSSRRGKTSMGGLVWKGASSNNGTASSQAMENPLYNSNFIGSRRANSVSLSSTRGVGGSIGLVSAMDRPTATGGCPDQHVEVSAGGARYGGGGRGCGVDAEVPTECFSGGNTPPVPLHGYPWTSGTPMQTQAPPFYSGTPEAVHEGRLPPGTVVFGDKLQGSSSATGATHPPLDSTMVTMTPPNSIPSTVPGDNTCMTQAGKGAHHNSTLFTETVDDGDGSSRPQSDLRDNGVHEHVTAASTSVRVFRALDGELWHTVGLMGDSDAGSEQRTPTAMNISAIAVASMQLSGEEASVVGGVSLSGPPMPLLPLPQVACPQTFAVSGQRGRTSAAAMSDSLREVPVSVSSFPSDGLARRGSEATSDLKNRTLCAPSRRSGLHSQICDTAFPRPMHGGRYGAPPDGEDYHHYHHRLARGDLLGLESASVGSADVGGVASDPRGSAARCVPLPQMENRFVLRRNNNHAGVVNVYEVSALITYYEMQCNCVLCDGAVLFAGLLKKVSGIPFPSYTLLLCPTVLSLLELWDGYEFEDLWRRSLGAPMYSRITSPISSRLV